MPVETKFVRRRQSVERLRTDGWGMRWLGAGDKHGVFGEESGAQTGGFCRLGR